MRLTTVKLLLGTAIAATLAFGADNSLGTWKLNLGRSNPTPPVKSLTLIRQAAEGGVKTTATVDLGKGHPITSSSIAKYDGKDYPVPNAPWDIAADEQVDANTFTTTARKTGGTLRSTSRTVISKDGKTMTTTSSGTNSDGQPFSSTTVFDKQ